MRRHGRQGTWLATDDYTGQTVYADKLKRDYWGNYAVKPLKRNLQEIASPLNDPQPVPFFRGPTYEVISYTQFTTGPLTVGLTNVPTPHSLASDVFEWDVGISDMQIGYNFMVR